MSQNDAPTPTRPGTTDPRRPVALPAWMAEFQAGLLTELVDEVGKLQRQIDALRAGRLDELDDLLESLRMRLERIEAKEVSEEVLALRAELAGLREQMATEVRTRRLVVVSEDGFEGVTAEADTEFSHLSVACRTPGVAPGDAPFHATSVDLHADNGGGEGVYAQVYLSGAGNVYGTFGIDKGDTAPDGWPTFDASLHVMQPNNEAGMEVDHKGLHHLHPTRR